MDKGNMVLIHKGGLSSHKKEWKYFAYRKMDETRVHHVK
jgi:hypothetical protein